MYYRSLEVPNRLQSEVLADQGTEIVPSFSLLHPLEVLLRELAVHEGNVAGITCVRLAQATRNRKLDRQ